MRELIRFRETNGWPDEFQPDKEPPGRAQGSPDVAFVRWTNSDGTTDGTGWIQLTFV
jgi:hypothetical protein